MEITARRYEHRYAPRFSDDVVAIGSLELGRRL